MCNPFSFAPIYNCVENTVIDVLQKGTAGHLELHRSAAQLAPVKMGQKASLLSGLRFHSTAHTDINSKFLTSTKLRCLLWQKSPFGRLQKILVFLTFARIPQPGSGKPPNGLTVHVQRVFAFSASLRLLSSASWVHEVL